METLASLSASKEKTPLFKLRLSTDYGYYLTINLKRLRKIDMRTKAFKTPDGFSIQRQKVAATLAEEEEKLREFHDEGLPTKSRLPRTPLLDDLTEASIIVNTSKPKPAVPVPRDDLAYEIRIYAARCGLCHSGIEETIKNLHWQVLAVL